MKKSIKTLTIIACVLTVVGIGLTLAAYFIFYSEDIPSKLQYKHKVTVEGEVIGIDISSSYYDVSIEKGDEFCVFFENSFEPGNQIYIEDGILKINGQYCDDLDVFGFEMSPGSKLYDPFGGNVSIRVPEDVYMQLVYADIGCGSFKMKDMSCARLVAQVGLGCIELQNVDVEYDKFLECKLGPIIDSTK